MYTTAFILVVLGIPGAVLTMWVFFLNHTLSLGAAVESALYLMAAELTIGGGLYVVAKWMARKRGLPLDTH